MHRGPSNETLVAAIREEAASGTSVQDIVRKLGVVERTVYRIGKKHGIQISGVTYRQPGSNETLVAAIREEAASGTSVQDIARKLGVVERSIYRIGRKHGIQITGAYYRRTRSASQSRAVARSSDYCECKRCPHCGKVVQESR